MAQGVAMEDEVPSIACTNYRCNCITCEIRSKSPWCGKWGSMGIGMSTLAARQQLSQPGGGVGRGAWQASHCPLLWVYMRLPTLKLPEGNSGNTATTEDNEQVGDPAASCSARAAPLGSPAVRAGQASNSQGLCPRWEGVLTALVLQLVLGTEVCARGPECSSAHSLRSATTAIRRSSWLP